MGTQEEGDSNHKCSVLGTFFLGGGVKIATEWTFLEGGGSYRMVLDSGEGSYMLTKSGR